MEMMEMHQLVMEWRIQTMVFLSLEMSQSSEVEEWRKCETVVGGLLVLMMVSEKVMDLLVL